MTITLRAVKGSELTHAELDGNFTDLDGRISAGGGGSDFGTNTLVALDFPGATPDLKLQAAAAAITATPGSYRLIVPPGDYDLAGQMVLTAHAGHVTELVGWGFPKIHRTNAGTDQQTIVTSGPGSFHITGINGAINPAATPTYFVLSLGGHKSLKITGCRFIDCPFMMGLRCQRGGNIDIVFSDNYLENISAGALFKAENIDLGLNFDRIDVSRNVCVNVRAELCSVDRGNSGAHGNSDFSIQNTIGVHNNKVFTAHGNKWYRAPATPSIGENAVIAVSSTEHISIIGNQIDGYQGSCFRFEDISNEYIITGNHIYRGMGWDMAWRTPGTRRYQEFSGIHLMDCVHGIISGNIIRDSVWAGISMEDNPSRGRVKRAIIAGNQIIGAGGAGILVNSQPDSEATVQFDTDYLAPYDDATVYITDNQIGYVTTMIKQTGRSAFNDRAGIYINADFDVNIYGRNRVYECDCAAIRKVGRPLNNSSPIGAIDHTSLKEVEFHPTVNFRGVRFKNDSARGFVISDATHAGWVDLMDLGLKAKGTLDVSISTGDSNYSYTIGEIDVVNPVAGAVTLTSPRPGNLGTLGSLSLQIAADARTLQARCTTTQPTTSHRWSVDFQGERWLHATSLPAINRRKEFSMAYAAFDGTTDWLGPNAMTLGTATVAERQIPGTLGRHIGDIDGGSGFGSAFDGVTASLASAAAVKPSATFGWIGKSFFEKHVFSKAVIYGSSNAGFFNSITPSVTLQIYGKNGPPPTSTSVTATTSDGTLIGSLAPFTDTTDETAGRTVTSTDTVTGWDHIFARVTHNGAANQLNISELVLFELSATASKRVFFSLWCQPTSGTWSAAAIPLLHIGTIASQIFRIGLTTTGRIEVLAAGGTVAVRSLTGMNFVPPSGGVMRLMHIMGSIDTVAQTRWLAVNRIDVLDPAQTSLAADATILIDGANGAVGWVPETADQTAAPTKYAGTLGDVFVSAQYVPDIATAVAYTEGLYREPRYLREDGVSPGLAPPRIFLSGGLTRSLTAYPTNRGTAGGFTLNGVL